MHNRVAFLLKMIGLFCVVGGLFIGLNSYEVTSSDPLYASEKDYGALFTWIAYGGITAVILYAFAEIIVLLEENKNNTDKLIQIIKENKGDTIDKKAAVKRESREENVSDYIDKEFSSPKRLSAREVEEYRKDLQARGYGNNVIEALVDEKTKE